MQAPDQIRRNRVVLTAWFALYILACVILFQVLLPDLGFAAQWLVALALALVAYGLLRALGPRFGLALAPVSYASRKRWALFILILALPTYIITAVTVVTLLTPDIVTGRPNILLELAIYLGLGILWVFPLKRVFLGIGQADPDAPPSDDT